MRCLLLLTTAWALAPISTPPKRTEFREGIGGATKEQAVAVGETVACAKQPIGPRDVVIRCYDISSDGKLLCGINKLNNALDGNLDMPTEAPNVIVLSSVAGTA